jgi:hypothetical protein
MSGPRKTLRPPALSAERLADVTSAVRALCVIYNTSLTYDTSHPVFLKATEERIPAFRHAIEIGDELPLTLSQGQIRVGTLALEPASALFQKLARDFEALGVTGLTLLSGVSADDLRTLMRILTKKSREIAAQGVQPLLDQEGVQTIQATHTRAHAARQVSGSRRASPPADGGTAAPAGQPLPADLFPGLPPTRADAGDVPLRDAVRRMVGELPLTPADGYRLAEMLGDELERRVDAVAAPLRSLLQLALDAMSHAGFPVLIVDNTLTIRAANSLGHIVLDGQGNVPPDSSLGRFLLSETPTGSVEVAGQRLDACQLGGPSAEGPVHLVWLLPEPVPARPRRSVGATT